MTGGVCRFRGSRFPAALNALHLVDGETQGINNILDIFDFIEGQRPTLAGFEVFVEHLVAAEVKFPHVLRHGGEYCGDCDRILTGGQISNASQAR